MKNLEAIDQELAAAKKELETAVGTPTEVYSRIVGYYRSVRNWNRGKREEYRERVLYDVCAGVPESKRAAAAPVSEENGPAGAGRAAAGSRVLLFVRAACPACPTAKDAAAKLPVAVELVDADTEAGLARAERLQVFSTPTAILLDTEGREIRRVRDARGIAALGAGMPGAEAALPNAASL